MSDAPLTPTLCGAIDHPPGVAAGVDPKTSSATRA
jgi:hypothetical protein